MNARQIAEQKKARNGKLSLRPLKFEEAVKDLLKVKPEHKESMEKKGGR